jgi:mono/diheme cytochrome c family protein
MSLKYLLPGLVLVVATCQLCMAAPQPKAQSHATQRAPAPTSGKQATATQDSVHQDEGQRIFDQNCSRCHTAPDGFAPRISGTVVRHMRVRASLSQHDERELLRFLNP